MGAGTLPYTTGAGTPVERRHSRLTLPSLASKELPSGDRDSNASSVIG